MGKEECVWVQMKEKEEADGNCGRRDPTGGGIGDGQIECLGMKLAERGHSIA